MAKRLYMTSADYVAIAVSPALIMALVGSLVFFLIEVMYVGQYEARLNYAFALFVFAAVLIGRISIEMGSERALLFALPLGLAMFLFLVRFVDHPSPFSHLINLALLGVVWWCAHKLTWDCTLIDDDQDASGEGLMQRIGVDAPESTQDPPPSDGATANELLERSEQSESGAMHWWQRLAQRQRGPHTPGLWVLYFSLAALPLFGIGQYWIPASDVGRRRYAFFLLLIYVSAALALLVTTSFLGLRRYLRQRRIEMPTPIAATWVGFGMALIVVVTFIAALIPRPAAEVAISQVPWQATSSENLSSSRTSVGSDGTQQADGATASGKAPVNEDVGSQPTDEEGATRSETQTSDGQEPGSQQNITDSQSDESAGETSGETGKSDSQSSAEEQGSEASDSSPASEPPSSENSSSSNGESGKPAEPNETNGAGQPADASAEKAEADETAAEPDESDQADQSGTAQPPESPRQSDPLQTIQNLPSSIGGLAGVLKLLFYAVAALLVACVAWKYRRQLVQAMADILRQLRELLANLFGGTLVADGGTTGAEAQSAVPRPRRFADFRDPFATGEHRQAPPDELVRYTFAAFEAWASDRGCPRTPDRTPYELIRSAIATESPMLVEARRMVRLYNELAYASRKIPRESASELQELWKLMRRAEAPIAPAPGVSGDNRPN